MIQVVPNSNGTLINNMENTYLIIALISIAINFGLILSVLNRNKTTNEWADLIDWWNKQSCRWWDGDSIDSNKYDCIKNNELRPKVGPFLQNLFPNNGACFHCKWPWSLVNSHTTDTFDRSGVFVLCDYCWNSLKGYGQTDKIRQYYHQARSKYWCDKYSALDINKALDKDLNNGLPFTLTSVYPDDLEPLIPK